MSDVLVVQPDPRQAETLRDIFRRVAAELVLVHSTREAMDAIAYRMPDLILLSSLLSPRDEDALMSHLRTLDGASHLQTLTIPLFRAAGAPAAERKSAFSFRKKAKAAAPVGCDPAVFAEEVVAHLRRATEIRERPVLVRSVPSESMFTPQSVESAFSPESVQAYEPVSEQPYQAVSEPAYEPVAQQTYEPVAEQAYEPVFERAADPVVEPVVQASPDSVLYREDPVAAATPVIETEQPRITFVPHTDAVFPAEAVAPAESVVYNEVDLASELTSVAKPVEEDPFDFAAALDRARLEADRRSAEIAQAQRESDALREAAVAEARAAAEREAREAVAADLARVQAEAEAMREEAIAEARAVAEQEAKEKLHSELARVRSETEVTVAEAVQKVKLEAEEAERARIEAERLRVEAQEAFAAELARVRAEVEQSLAAQLEASRAEAERMRASEANAVRERAAIESQMKAELDRLKFVAAQVRKADESETKKAAEQIKQLERELGTVRAEADERQATQLEELRAQMAEMRVAAAQHARAAAAEAVASGVARATGHSSAAGAHKVNVIRMQPRPIQAAPAAVHAVAPIAFAPEPRTEQAAPPHAAGSKDYYNLWQPTPSTQSAQVPASRPEEEVERQPIDFRRHAKWALPVAACLLLVTNRGPAMSTLARFVKPAEKPVLTVQPVEVEQFIEVVEKRVGRLKVESTPPGAEAIVDGRSYGPTPVTIPDLEVGTHMLVLKSSSGTVARKVTIKSTEIAVVSEAIFSGWLAIFSPIPITLVIDGKPAGLTDDGRVMVAPGKHVVELISERFNYRTTETLEVRPGATTAHTLELPMGTLRVSAPEGADIRVDGQPAAGVAASGFAVSVGSHEVSATHPTLGERRMAVDVMHGSLTEVTLQFGQ
jgi:hypothetical protein